jgi:hypothetical protein
MHGGTPHKGIVETEDATENIFRRNLFGGGFETNLLEAPTFSFTHGDVFELQSGCQVDILLLAPVAVPAVSPFELEYMARIQRAAGQVGPPWGPLPRSSPILPPAPALFVCVSAPPHPPPTIFLRHLFSHGFFLFHFLRLSSCLSCFRVPFALLAASLLN